MNRSPGIRLAITASVLATVATGCSSSGPGTSTGSADQTGPAWSNPFPQRPHTIEVQATDPCTTLTEGQRRELGIAATGRNDRSPDNPACLFGHSGGGYEVLFVRTTGARALLPGYPEQQGQGTYTNPSSTEVDGFGAVRAGIARGAPADCSFTVDVGDNSSIQFAYTTLAPQTPEASRPEAFCDKARQFASLGLRTLSGQ